MQFPNVINRINNACVWAARTAIYIVKTFFRADSTFVVLVRTDAVQKINAAL